MTLIVYDVSTTIIFYLLIGYSNFFNDDYMTICIYVT